MISLAEASFIRENSCNADNCQYYPDSHQHYWEVAAGAVFTGQVCQDKKHRAKTEWCTDFSDFRSLSSAILFQVITWITQYSHSVGRCLALAPAQGLTKRDNRFKTALLRNMKE